MIPLTKEQLRLKALDYAEKQKRVTKNVMKDYQSGFEAAFSLPTKDIAMHLKSLVKLTVSSKSNDVAYYAHNWETPRARYDKAIKEESKAQKALDLFIEFEKEYFSK